MLETLEALDRALFLYLNGLHVDWLDPIFHVITTKWTWIPLYALLAFLVYRFYGWKSLLLFLGVIALVVLTTDQATNWAKHGFGRFRPCKNLEIGHLVHLVTGNCGGKYGFFSGHSSNSFALATCIGIVLKRPKWLWLLLGWAAVVAYSRVYVGVHYPGDILVGAFVGILLGFLYAKLYLALHLKYSHKLG